MKPYLFSRFYSETCCHEYYRRLSFVFIKFISEEDISVVPDTDMNHDYNEDETIQDNFDLAPYLDTEIAVKKETHEESSLNDFQCRECGKKCKNEHEFLIHKNYHYKRKSGGDKVFCEKCNKNISKKWFTRHIQTLHPGQEDLVKFDFFW